MWFLEELQVENRLHGGMEFTMAMSTVMGQSAEFSSD